jgi:hypothetical protein
VFTHLVRKNLAPGLRARLVPFSLTRAMPRRLRMRINVNSRSNLLSADACHDWLRLRNSNSTQQKRAHPQLPTAWVSG